MSLSSNSHPFNSASPETKRALTLDAMVYLRSQFEKLAEEMARFNRWMNLVELRTQDVKHSKFVQHTASLREAADQLTVQISIAGELINKKINTLEPPDTLDLLKNKTTDL